MKRETKDRDKVVWVIPEREFMQKLGISGKFAGVYWSTVNHEIRVTCKVGEKK